VEWLSIELGRICTSYFLLPYWPFGDTVYFERRVFAQNQRFYSIFGPREQHYRCMKDCVFGEILWGMCVSMKSCEVPFLVVIRKTMKGKKLWPFEEFRKSLCSELCCLRFLRHSSVHVDLTNYYFISFSHQLMHFHLQLCISLLSYIKIT
jgi:hypothetical protein